MPYCSRCGSEHDESALFCPKCGATVGSQSAERLGVERGRGTSLNPTSIAIISIVGVLVVAAIIVSSLNLFNPGGVIIGSSNLATRTYTFSDFTAVSVDSGFKFSIKRSDSYKVTTIANENLGDYIQVSKVGDTLKVGLKSGYSFISTSLKVEVEMPNLYKLEIDGGSNGGASGFASSHDFTVTSSGGARLDMSGDAGNLVMEASGGSQLYLSDFTVNNANVALSGGSQAEINLDGRLDANVSGGSRLSYYGTPTLGNISTSGGGTVSKK